MSKPIILRTFIDYFREHRRELMWGGIILSILASPIMAKIWWENTRTYPEIVYPDKAVFHRGGWFFNSEKDEIYLLHGKWFLAGEELDVPMEGPYNDVCVVRFEDRGRVYRVNKRQGTKTELRVKAGEWSERCDDDTWASLYDPILYDN